MGYEVVDYPDLTPHQTCGICKQVLGDRPFDTMCESHIPDNPLGIEPHGENDCYDAWYECSELVHSACKEGE